TESLSIGLSGRCDQRGFYKHRAMDGLSRILNPLDLSKI
ncbi:MAG: hypothetical protein ACJASR_002151, partial [Psychroserpens sp.]